MTEQACSERKTQNHVIDLLPGAQTLALRLQQFVLKTTRQTTKRILAA